MGEPDDFESATENLALVELLRRRIDDEGPITFHDFMEAVLYQPQLGYYTSRAPMGREGDYLTSPEVHPVFGALVGKQIAQLWELLGCPERFDLVEQGAGSGALARDVLRWAERRAPEFARAVRYRIVEISASLRRRQEETLSIAGASVEWLDALPDEIDGCLLSNELLDSFPVHRIVRENGALREIFVSHREGRFEEVHGPLSSERIVAYFEDLGLLPGDGCTAEVNLHAIDSMAAAARALRRGFVLTFDYGYPAEELYAPWRRDGTLLCFYRHNPSIDPYARIGKQDMTAHVDFTTLMRTGEQHGLEVAGFTTQSRFLAALGIGAGVDAIAKESPEALEEYYARRRAVQELTDPAGLGRIRVLAQRKGVAAAELLGFMRAAVPETGHRAPDFSLPSTNGEVRLSELLTRGRVLLAFYFEDATPTCSTEIEALKDAYDTLRELGANVVAISADGIESHRAFSERLGGLPFPLASDENLAVARAYDAVVEDDPRRSRRALFVIESDGTVSYAANPYSPNNLSQLEGALRALGVEM